MLLSNAMKKLDKNGFNVTNEGQIAYAIKGNAEIVLSCNPRLENGDRNVVAIKVKRATEMNDAASDYFPGSFASSLKQALEWAKGY